MSSNGENTMEVKTPKEFFEKVLPTKFNPAQGERFRSSRPSRHYWHQRWPLDHYHKKRENGDKRRSRALACHHAKNDGHGLCRPSQRQTKCRQRFHDWKTRIQRKHRYWLKTARHGVHVKKADKRKHAISICNNRVREKS